MAARQETYHSCSIITRSPAHHVPQLSTAQSTFHPGLPLLRPSRRFIGEFHADMAALNCRPPDLEPRATEHVGAMVADITRMVAGGHAYAAGGDVLFAVDSVEGYGRLSGRSLVRVLLPRTTAAGAKPHVCVSAERWRGDAHAFNEAASCC